MAKHAIVIDKPLEGSSHGWEVKVRGRVRSHDCDVVQLMVLAADGLWYPQPKVKRHGMRFHGLAYLGWEHNPNAIHYVIAAGVGGSYIEGAQDALPDEALWVKACVKRIP